MPEKYVVRQELSMSGTEQTVIRREPTAVEVGSAIGLGLGLLVAHNRNQKYKELQAAVGRAVKAVDTGDYQAAIDMSAPLVSHKEQQARFAGHMVRGRAHRYLGNYQEAASDLTEAIRLAQGDEETSGLVAPYIDRAAVYLRLEKYAEAIRDANMCTKLAPDSDIGNYFLGLALEKIGDLPQAIANMSRAITLDASDPLSYIARGRMYGAGGNIGAAEADFARAIALAPERASVWVARGDFRHEQGKEAEALTDYAKAAALDVHDTAAARGHARSLVALGKNDEADVEQQRAEQLATADSLFNRYETHARELAGAGLKRVPPEKDAHASTNWVVLILGLVVVAVITIVMAADSYQAGCVGFGGLFVALLLVLSAIGGPKARRTYYARYSAEMIAAEETMARFKSFFSEYVAASGSSTMHTLRQKTAAMFDELAGVGH